MKKLLHKLGVLVLMAPIPTMAAIGAGNCPSDLSGDACDETTGLYDMVTRVSNTILLIVGVIAVLMLIVGGFQYVMSAGNPEQVNKAKNTIFYAIIGIVVTLIAYVAVGFVLDQLT